MIEDINKILKKTLFEKIRDTEGIQLQEKETNITKVLSAYSFGIWIKLKIHY